MNTIAIVIVNWNGKKDTLACLRSLEKLHKKHISVRIIVVDNGSTDNSAKTILKEFPDVHVIRNENNLGFSGGNNVGIVQALAENVDAVWLLNNDTMVDTDALMPLVEALEAQNAGIVGSKIYFAKGREFHDRYTQQEKGNVIWFAGGIIDWQNMYASHRGVDEVDEGQFNVTEETAFITGCSMMITRAVFDAVGLLDDKFYLYLEDLDFCIRAQREGFKLLYVPDSKIWHENAGSTNKPGHELHQYYITRNRLLVGIRYASVRTKLALVREAVRFVVSGTRAQRKAVLDAVMGKFGGQYIWKQTQR